MRIRQLIFIALLTPLLGLIANAQLIAQIPAFHPRYQRIATLPGDIMDINSEAVLYLDWHDLSSPPSISQPVPPPPSEPTMAGEHGSFQMAIFSSMMSSKAKASPSSNSRT